MGKSNYLIKHFKDDPRFWLWERGHFTWIKPCAIFLVCGMVYMVYCNWKINYRFNFPERRYQYEQQFDGLVKGKILSIEAIQPPANYYGVSRKSADKIAYEFSFKGVVYKSICIIPVNKGSEINLSLSLIRNLEGDKSFDILFEKSNPIKSTVKLY